MAINILCVDDETDAVEAEKLLLQFEGYNVSVATTAKDAMLLIEHNQYDLFILDNHLPDKSGLDLCRWIRAGSKDIPIIIYSGSSRRSEIDAASVAGASKYLMKPAEFEDMLSIIQELTKSQSL